MAPVNGFRQRSLPLPRFVPKTRDVRIDKPDEKICRIGSQQYCGREGAIFAERIVAVSFPRKRFTLELEAQMILSQELGSLDQAKGPALTMLATEVGRLLNGLMSKFQERVKSA